MARVKVEFLPDTLPKKTFIVQAGAYRKRHHALLAQRSLRTRYDTVRVTKKGRKSRRLYRVQLGPFPTRAQAEDIARQIRPLGYKTLILPRS